MNPALPTLEETALAALLHDIGKFVQRAHTGLRDLPPEVRNLEATALPVSDGRHTHYHALWTEYFFHWLGREGLHFPGELNISRIARLAVYHHNPDSPAAWLVALADRLSAGLDRKARDEQQEAGGEPRSFEQFVRTPLDSPFAGVNLGRGQPPAAARIPLDVLAPGESVVPRAALDTSDYRTRYARLWRAFQEELRPACSLDELPLFCEALLSLSERFLFAVPSSTIDQPDVSLHDHSRTAAAIAAALYGWHAHNGTLADTAAIQDEGARKFRFLTGDLSGIQNSLFLLAHQQVRGVSRILRARSFLIGMIGEAAALLCRRILSLSIFSQLQAAGGQFMLLVPNTPEVEERLDEARRSVERWMFDRYCGELAVNLALSPPFSGRDLKRENFPDLHRSVRLSMAGAKLRSFATCYHPVHERPYTRERCSACGVRPAEREEPVDGGEAIRRCEPCDDEARLGRILPRVAALGWTGVMPHDADFRLKLFDQLWLACYVSPPARPRGMLSLARLWRAEETAVGPFALRFLANYVPRLTESDLNKKAYADLEDDEPRRPGEIKTFEQLSRDALEDENGELIGEPLLAVLKADVDYLGQIFSRGLPTPSLSRYASISRMLDFFFTGQLGFLLRSEYPDTYTVYAGGDDLLLIGPWRQMARLAMRLQEEFARWTGHNPNLTLSAGLELMKVTHPLNRVAHAAEERLGEAKEAGRNRVSAFAREPVLWEEYARQVNKSERLSQWLRERALSQAFLQRVLVFDRERLQAEPPDRRHNPQSDEPKLALQAASWRARWGYQLGRNVRDNKQVPEKLREEIVRELNSLLGLDAELNRTGRPPSCRIAISIALYKNRTGSERR